MIIPDNHSCFSCQRSVRFMCRCGSAPHVLPERGADWTAASPAVAASGSERRDNCSLPSGSFFWPLDGITWSPQSVWPDSSAEFWAMLPTGGCALSALMRADEGGKKKKEIEGRSAGWPCHFFFLLWSPHLRVPNRSILSLKAKPIRTSVTRSLLRLS